MKLPTALVAFVFVATLGFLSTIVPFIGPVMLIWWFVDFACRSFETTKRETFLEAYVPLAVGILVGTYFFVDLYSVSRVAGGHFYLIPWTIAFTAVFWMRHELVTQPPLFPGRP